MPETSTEKYLIVEQIVEALVGTETAPLDALIAQARELEDASSMASTLHEHVERHRDDSGALEGLMILCFADPKLPRRLRFNVVGEGRRLAGLLQQAGDNQRAQEVLEALSRRTPGNRGVEKDLAAIMRRTGNVDRLIERYLKRAEEAESAGRRRDAITWLREVLMLDRSRRDVARMIRDLQYESRRVKDEWRKRAKQAGILVLLLGVIAGIVSRELKIKGEYAAIPAAQAGNRDSLERRLAGIDALIENNPLWIGIFEAGQERSEIRVEIERIHAREAEQEQRKADRRAERRVMAEAATVRARQAIERSDFEGAAQQYEEALRVAPQSWSERERAQADLEAVRKYLEEQAR